MKKLLLGLAALASGCTIEIHPGNPLRLRDWTELPEGGEAVVHLNESSLHIYYYGPESNHRDSFDDDIVTIGRYIPFHGYYETDVRVGDRTAVDLYGYRFRFNVINDNDGIIENNRVVVYWDRL